MNKCKIAKGSSLAHFFLTYWDYSLWTYDNETKNEIEIKVRDINTDKWYYVEHLGKTVHLTEVDAIGSDSELKRFLEE
ncbi:hypothetical protein [Metabacillus litoralis]|uniref:Uncharacterized protein n=1 Tax=Metabacillus litoralis TaxID=152268 RepID=A0A179STQ0_9BACI|nr:hypothetical protein [Metabacillus litoralis]OAS85107.1 hypothetical protein A6K24_06240 [Metabacillus litoralis]